MNDETCYLNIKARAEELYEDEVDLELSRQVTKKIVINILLGFYWTDLNSIKSLINEVGILREQNQMDEIISNITILDQKSHRIRIKEEYYKEYDPYIFYKIPSVQQHVTSEFSSKKDINEKVDLVGGKYYTNPPEKLKNIKKNLFLSNLPNFLSLFLKGFTKDTAPLVRPVLKLVLLHLQSTKDAFKNSSEEEFESLKKKTIELYGTKEFEEALNNILREEDFKDCKLCIGKINKLFKLYHQMILIS